MSKPTLYGIPNCDTVQKARIWLAQHGIDVVFHDFKKQGIDAERLEAWLKQVPRDELINRRGSTWRALDDAAKVRADSDAGAIALMLAKPSVIKRPLLDNRGQLSVGFDTARYAKLFSAG